VATESDLRDLLQGPDPEGRATIDVDAVLRRARARRRPRAIAASAVGALALVGVMTPVVLISQQAATPESLMIAEDASGASEASDADGYDGATAPSATSLVSCGAPVADHAPGDGLVLEVTPVTAEAGTAGIPIDVALRNDGTVSMLGVTATQPVVVFSRDGVVLWYSDAIQDASGVRVDLAPGESLTYRSTLEPLTCAADDEASAADGGGLGEDLPTASVGSYRVSAMIDFIPDDGTQTVVVTGPAAPVELR
jgi:hypothetical protein